MNNLTIRQRIAGVFGAVLALILVIGTITVQSLRQSALAIDRLNAVSGGLHAGVSRFRLQEPSAGGTQ